MTDTNQNERSTLTLFLRRLYKNLVAIILVAVLFGLLGLGYSVLWVRPVYTASRAVILRMSLSFDGNSSSTVNDDVAFVKAYMPTVETAIKNSPEILEEAGRNYNYKVSEEEREETPVTSGSISINYNTNSLIFTIGYSDTDRKAAADKLDSLIEAASLKLEEGRYLPTSNVSLIDVRGDEPRMEVNSFFAKYIILGMVIGLVIGVAAVFIKFALDNTVKSKDELEEITGVDVVAAIFSEEDDKKKRKNRRGNKR